MKIDSVNLVIHVTENGRTTYKSITLERCNELAKFVDDAAGSFEKRAFALYDEIAEHIKTGEIDKVVELAPEAKTANDLYLLLNDAADQLYEETPS